MYVMVKRVYGVAGPAASVGGGWSLCSLAAKDGNGRTDD